MTSFKAFSRMSALLLASLMFASQAVAETPGDPFDGAVFEGLFREAGVGSGGDEDRLVFRDGIFISEACRDYGFTEARYTVNEENGVVSFRAVSESPSHGQMRWRGYRSGNRLKADVVWTKERWYWDIRREYQFIGSVPEP